MPSSNSKLTEIFHAAVSLSNDEQRAYLEKACQGDAVLRQDVDRLIAAHENAGSFINTPAYERGAELLANKGKLTGRTLGHYRILSLLGTGGMGEVYLADDTRLDRKVALKILPPDISNDAERMRRFVREAKSASALNHP